MIVECIITLPTYEPPTTITFFSEEATILSDCAMRSSNVLGPMDDMTTAMLTVKIRIKPHEDCNLSKARNMINSQPERPASSYMSGRRITPGAKWGMPRGLGKFLI